LKILPRTPRRAFKTTQTN